MDDSASEAIRRLFERYQAGGVEGALTAISTDAVFVVPPEASAEPDVYEGHVGARRYFAGFEGALDNVKFELLWAEDTGPGVALGELRLSGIGTTTRIAVEQLSPMVFTVKDGLIARIQVYGDLETARAAADTTP